MRLICVAGLGDYNLEIQYHLSLNSLCLLYNGECDVSKDFISRVIICLKSPIITAWAFLI